MRRAIELSSGLAAGALAIVTLGYLAFGPVICDTPNSCHGFASSGWSAPLAVSVVGIAMAAGFSAIGSWLHAGRRSGPAHGLQWFGAVLLLIGASIPYAGVWFLPAALLALDAAIIGLFPYPSLEQAGRHAGVSTGVRSLVGAIAGSLALLILSVVVLLVFMLVTGDLDRPELWEFPPGYHGWVMVEYENPAYPPLRVAGIYQVIRVPADGRVCTSTEMATGWVDSRYQYVHPNGRREELPVTGWGSGGQIWAGFSGPRQQVQSYPREAFFVGSEQQLGASWSSEPRLDDAHWPGCSRSSE